MQCHSHINRTATMFTDLSATLRHMLFLDMVGRSSVGKGSNCYKAGVSVSFIRNTSALLRILTTLHRMHMFDEDHSCR